MAFLHQLYVNGFYTTIIVVLPIKYADARVIIIAAPPSALLFQCALWMELKVSPSSGTVVELVFTRAFGGAAAELPKTMHVAL